MALRNFIRCGLATRKLAGGLSGSSSSPVRSLSLSAVRNDDVEVTVDAKGIRKITMNRPEKYNAITDQVEIIHP